MESYDKHSKKPRFLSCGHGFCEACLIELLQTKGHSLTCPNCRKVTSHVYDIQNLPAGEEPRPSGDISKKSNDEKEPVLMLQRDIQSLQASLDDFKKYTASIKKKSIEATRELKIDFEIEYEKISSAFDKIIDQIQKEEKLTENKLMDNMLKQQNAIILQQKAIKENIDALTLIDNNLSCVEHEAEKYLEDEKMSVSEEEKLSRQLKETLLEQMDQLYKLLDFKPIDSVSFSKVEIDLNQCKSLLDSVKLAEPRKIAIIEETHTASKFIPIIEKMRQIRHPTLVCFEEIKGITKSIRYNMEINELSSEEIKAPPNLELSLCKSIIHPNGNSLFLIQGGQIFLYDSLNAIILRKPMFLEYKDLKNSAVALLDNNIFVIGGINFHKASKTVIKYHILSEQWSEITPLITKRHSASACPINEYQICIAGGQGKDDKCLSSIEIYDAQINSCELLDLALQIPRTNFNLVSVEKDRIIVIGGEYKNVIGTVEEIDLLKKVSISLNGPIHPRKNAVSCVLGKNVYIFGGSNDSPDPLSVGELFIVNENKWELIISPYPDLQKRQWESHLITLLTSFTT